MADIKFEPCPICGSEMRLDQYSIWVSLKCTKCPLDFGRYWFEKVPALAKKWNNRVGK